MTLEEQEILFFLDQPPMALRLYAIFKQAVLSRIENVQIRAQKTQIGFSNRHLFACVSLLPLRKAAQRRDGFIVVSFGLGDRLLSPRVDGATEPYPHRWTHHIFLSKPEEIDEELMAWIAQASAFSAAKR